MDETPQEAVETAPAAAPTPNGALIARRDQLQAAVNENRNIIRQLEEELATRRAMEQRMIGQLQAYAEILGPKPNGG